jgi:heptosyltransferase III
MISSSTKNNISVFIAYRGSDRHLLDIFLDLKLWFSDITLVGPSGAAISEEIKVQGGDWIESESPNICELWEKGMGSKNSPWCLLLEGREYLSTRLKESIIETANSSPVPQAWFPIKRKIFFLKQHLKYPLEWTNDPRSGLLYVGTDKSVQINSSAFPKEDILKGESTYFAENTVTEVIINTMHRGEQAADELYRAEPSLGSFTLVSRALVTFLSNFFKNWIFRKGMQEGFAGLVFSLLDSAALVMGHLRYHEKYIRSGRQIKDQRNSIKKILIIKLRGLGDVVLATPVIKNIKKFMPGVSISMLTFNFCKPILENNPHLESLYGLSGEADKGELSQLVSQLSRKNFDLILNLHARNFSSKLAYKIKARWRINRGYLIREKYSDVMVDHTPDKSSIEQDLDCLRAIGLNPKNKNPEIFITSKEIEWAKNFMAEQKIDSSKKLIIIHTSSYKDWNNNWGLERFVILSRQLIHDHGHQVLGCFPEKEQSTAKLFLNQVEMASVYVGPLRESMALISKADLMIDNTSGQSHISSALNIPTLVLTGPGDYKKVYYDTDIHKEEGLIFYKDVPCRDFFMSRCLPPDPCQNQVCLDHSVEDVLKKSLEVLLS